MIQSAADLRAEVDQRIDYHQGEIARLRQLGAALDAFIDQPGQDPDRGAAETPEPAGAPAPASQPWRGPADAGSIPAAPASYKPVTCDGCGREFRSRQSLGPHKKGCRGGGVEVSKPPTNGAHPSRRETFLCSRNCGRSFPSRELLNQHETQASCQVRPTPPPRSLSDRPPTGLIPGMGE